MNSIPELPPAGTGPGTTPTSQRPTAPAGALPPGDSIEPGGSGTDPRTALLFPGSATQVLERIVPGDPLGIGARAVRALTARALVLDPRRLARRAFALVAWDAAQRRDGSGHERWPGLEAWLDARVQRAVEELLEEEGAGRDALGEEPAPWGADAGREDDGLLALATLALPLGLDPDEVEAGCARFHGLPAEDRRALRALCQPPGYAPGTEATIAEARPASRSSHPGGLESPAVHEDRDRANPRVPPGAPGFEEVGAPTRELVARARRALRALCLPPEPPASAPHRARPSAPSNDDRRSP